MRLGGSLALIATGAILTFAVATQVSGVSLGTIGAILLIVGAFGLLWTLILMSARRRTDVGYGRHGVSYVEPMNPVDPRY